jgi:hypothetical protein
LGDEAVFGLEESLSGKPSFRLLVLVAFVILLAVIFNNIGDLYEKTLMNAMELVPIKEENKKINKQKKNFLEHIKATLGNLTNSIKTPCSKKKYYGFKALAIFVTSVLMLVTAYCIGKLADLMPEVAKFNITFPCCGDSITIFNNDKNIFFLMWAEFGLFLLLYKLLLPLIEKKYDPDYKEQKIIVHKDSWSKITNSKTFEVLSCVIGTFIAAIVANVSLNVSNSIQSLSGNNSEPYLVCMAFIVLAGLILVGYNIMHFMNGKKLEIDSITDQELSQAQTNI